MAAYRGYELYYMTKEDILDAIQSACNFFQIPMPAVIRNETGDIDSITGFFDSNRSSYFDDEIRFNLDQLIPAEGKTHGHALPEVRVRLDIPLPARHST